MRLPGGPCSPRRGRLPGETRAGGSPGSLLERLPHSELGGPLSLSVLLPRLRSSGF